MLFAVFRGQEKALHAASAKKSSSFLDLNSYGCYENALEERNPGHRPGLRSSEWFFS